MATPITQETRDEVYHICLSLSASVVEGDRDGLCDALVFFCGSMLGLAMRLDPARSPQICTVKTHQKVGNADV